MARAVASFALLVALVATVPTAATAGQFVIRQCNDGAGRGVEVTSGFVQVWENRTASDGCAGGGTLSFTMPNNQLAPFGTNGQSMGYSFILPSSTPNTKITRAEAVLTVPPATMDPGLSQGHVTMHSDGPATTYDRFDGQSSWGGLPSVNRGGDLVSPSRFVRFLVYCYSPCNFQGSPTMQIGGTAITIDDPIPPVVPTFESSGLLDGTAQKGTKKLRYATSDADSGIKRIELRTAAGIQLASTIDGQGCSYTRPVPCSQERYQESFDLDTTRLADGKHTLELWATDASGNQRKTALPAFTVQNNPVAVATPTPAPTTGAGTPTPTPVVGGTTPTPTPTPTATPKPTATPVTGTGADQPPGDSAPGSTSTAISFQVSSKTPRRGQRVTFSGAVSPVPSSAGRVMIEAKVRKKWITAAVVRTREGGAFTWSHSFSRRGTFTMRARLLGSVEAKTKPSVSQKKVFRVR